MDQLAGDRDGFGRVTPFLGEAVIPTHGLKNLLVSLGFPVRPFRTPAGSKGLDESLVDLSGFADPSAVGVWESFGKVEPRPHNHGGTRCEEPGVSELRYNGLKICPFVQGLAVMLPALPEHACKDVHGSSGGEQSQVEGPSGQIGGVQ